MGSNAPNALVRELSRRVLRVGKDSGKASVSVLDELADAVLAGGLLNGRIVTQTSDGAASVTFSFPPGLAQGEVLDAIDRARALCIGSDAEIADRIEAVKPQRVTGLDFSRLSL